MNAYPDPHPATGRRLVTVAQWHDRPEALVDTVAYFYRPENEACGGEPWSQVDSTDKDNDDLYDLWFVSGGCISGLGGDSPIYVRADHYDEILGRVDIRHLQDMPHDDQR